MSKCEVKNAFAKAFNLWAEHADVDFKEVTEGDFEVLIQFVGRSIYFINSYLKRIIGPHLKSALKIIYIFNCCKN